MLQSVALWMHEQQHKEIDAGDLRRWLDEMFREILGDWRAAERAVDRFLHVIQERTGLLVARGEGVYRLFPPDLSGVPGGPGRGRPGRLRGLHPGARRRSLVARGDPAGGRLPEHCRARSAPRA